MEVGWPIALYIMMFLIAGLAAVSAGVKIERLWLRHGRAGSEARWLWRDGEYPVMKTETGDRVSHQTRPGEWPAS